MARRSAASAWARSFQRGLKALNKVAGQAARASQRAAQASRAKAAKAAKAAAKQAAKTAKQTPTARPARPPRLHKPARAALPAQPAARPPRAAAAHPGGLAGFSLGVAGVRRYRLFVPPGLVRSEEPPLLVMLHGCGQDAAAFALATHMNRLALRERCLVLYPEQERLANAQGCWNWFDTRSGRAAAEAASIIAAIDRVVLLHGADPLRIAVAGLSAGAGMATLLASRYPARFCAVAMHSGVAPGVAQSTGSALRAMGGLARAPSLPPSGAPPLLVIHGSADRVVSPANGVAAAQRWAQAAGGIPSVPRQVQRGQRHTMTVTDYKARGRTVATLCLVEGLGHAWSGGAPGRPYSDPAGPDASRLIWAFMARQKRASGL